MRELNDFELNRQIFHVFLGIVIVALLLFNFIDKNIILAATLMGIIISYLSKKIRIPIVYNLLQEFERDGELEKFPGKGIIYYFIGIYIVLLLFPKDIAMASIMVLAFGDSVSHIFGLHFGRIKHPLSKTKFIEGSLAGFAAGFIGALVFLPWWEAILASLISMIVEAIEIKIGTQQIDDNLVVPFVAGTVIWMIRMI